MDDETLDGMCRIAVDGRRPDPSGRDASEDGQGRSPVPSRQRGPEYAGSRFSAQFHTHRVLRHRLSRAGATFQTSDEAFLTSGEPNFHPRDVLEDADGSLLVLDTGGWFLKGRPLSRVARPE